MRALGEADRASLVGETKAPEDNIRGRTCERKTRRSRNFDPADRLRTDFYRPQFCSRPCDLEWRSVLVRSIGDDDFVAGSGIGEGSLELLDGGSVDVTRQDEPRREQTNAN